MKKILISIVCVSTLYGPEVGVRVRPLEIAEAPDFNHEGLRPHDVGSIQALLLRSPEGDSLAGKGSDMPSVPQHVVAGPIVPIAVEEDSELGSQPTIAEKADAKDDLNAVYQFPSQVMEPVEDDTGDQSPSFSEDTFKESIDSLNNQINIINFLDLSSFVNGKLSRIGDIQIRNAVSQKMQNYQRAYARVNELMQKLQTDQTLGQDMQKALLDTIQANCIELQKMHADIIRTMNSATPKLLVVSSAKKPSSSSLSIVVDVSSSSDTGKTEKISKAEKVRDSVFAGQDISVVEHNTSIGAVSHEENLLSDDASTTELSSTELQLKPFEVATDAAKKNEQLLQDKSFWQQFIDWITSVFGKTEDKIELLKEKKQKIDLQAENSFGQEKVSLQEQSADLEAQINDLHKVLVTDFQNNVNTLVKETSQEVQVVYAHDSESDQLMIEAQGIIDRPSESKSAQQQMQMALDKIKARLAQITVLIVAIHTDAAEYGVAGNMHELQKKYTEQVNNLMKMRPRTKKQGQALITLEEKSAALDSLLHQQVPGILKI